MEEFGILEFGVSHVHKISVCSVMLINYVLNGVRADTTSGEDGINNNNKVL